jgi:hypothetical protein
LCSTHTLCKYWTWILIAKHSTIHAMVCQIRILTVLVRKTNPCLPIPLRRWRADLLPEEVTCSGHGRSGFAPNFPVKETRPRSRTDPIDRVQRCLAPTSTDQSWNHDSLAEAKRSWIISHVHLAYNPSFSAYFFSQNSIFLSQQISQQCFSAGLSAQPNEDCFL